jgi:hypothetical protein
MKKITFIVCSIVFLTIVGVNFSMLNGSFVNTSEAQSNPLPAAGGGEKDNGGGKDKDEEKDEKEDSRTCETYVGDKKLTGSYVDCIEGTTDCEPKDCTLN